MRKLVDASRPRRPALLLIDFQRDVCEPGGHGDGSVGVLWAQQILPQAERLLLAARRLGILIVHTREGYAADLSDCCDQRRDRARRAGAEIGARGPLGRIGVRGEPGQDIVARLRPLADELVLDKPSYGAFCTTPLERVLWEQSVGTLYLAGVTADGAVHTTLREAIDRGFQCHYVSDAISTFDAGLRQACEQMVRFDGGIWGELTRTEDVIATWHRTAARAAPSSSADLPRGMGGAGRFEGPARHASGVGKLCSPEPIAGGAGPFEGPEYNRKAAPDSSLR